MASPTGQFTCVLFDVLQSHTAVLAWVLWTATNRRVTIAMVYGDMRVVGKC